MADNSITQVGTLGQDPELKFMNNGNAQLRISIAVKKRWQDKNHEWQERTSWFPVIAYGQLAENAAQTLKKGYRVIVTGTLEQRSWETDSGDKRSVMEIIASAIGPDLLFVTADLHRSTKNDKNEGASQQAHMRKADGPPDYSDDPF